MPDIPTLREAGVKVSVVNWYGLIAPRNTPGALTARLARDVTKAMRDPDMEKRVVADGSSAVGGTPVEFATHLRAERDRWAHVIKQAGIKAKLR
jgi:tripartite-type tricarboxylate transporter receptor subunit TctC